MQEFKPLTPRQLDRHKRIVECTRDLLAEQGYEGLQMRVLADRAGVSPMTLYNRFGNKDDLILIALQELLAELAGRARVSRRTGIAFVLHTAQVNANQIVATPRYAKAMALMLFNGQPESPIVRTLLINNLDETQRQVREMMAAGELDDSVDAALLERNLSVCGWSTILLWMTGVIPDCEFEREYVRAPLLVLAPAMTPRTRSAYAAMLA